jgi:tellurite resistance protein TehA-like permease
MENETLKQVLSWVLTSGSGVVSWALLDAAIRYNWPQWVARLEDRPKRWLALALSGVLALGAWGIEVAMLYQPVPENWRDGVERGVAILFVAFGVSQIAHVEVRAARMRRIERARRAARG